MYRCGLRLRKDQSGTMIFWGRERLIDVFQRSSTSTGSNGDAENLEATNVLYDNNIITMSKLHYPTRQTMKQSVLCFKLVEKKNTVPRRRYRYLVSC